MADYIDSNLDDPAKFFTTFLWTGDGTSPRSLTGVGFQPDMMWSKIKDVGHEHSLVDDVRGVDNKRLKTNTNAAEDTTNTHGHFDSLDSDGFTVTGASGYYNVNRNNEPYVGWCWKESATSGFDIVAYTGNATNRTISHSLSAVPHWIIIKNRESTSSSAEHWLVYHKGIGNTHGILLNETAAKSDDATYFQDTDPTSSVFSIGTADRCNKNSEGNISYIWSEKQGFSKFGTYTGNSSTNGPFVYLGFRPSLIIGKVASDTNDWFMFDNKRSTFNPVDDSIYPNTDAAENTNHIIDFLSNGFKIRDSDGTVNSTGNTYIFAAFAESPFVNSKKIPNNAR